MIRLTHLLNQTVVIARKVTVSGDKQAYTTVTSVMANIQPGANNAGQLDPGYFGRVFRFYCDGGVDMKPGDRLRDDDNHYYTVMADGVTRRTMGSIDYTIVVVEKTKV